MERCPQECQHQRPSSRLAGRPHDQVGDAETMEDLLDALAVDLEAVDGARSLDDSVAPEVFPLTDDAALEMPQRRGKRLVLVPMPGESPQSRPDVELLEDGEALEASTTLRAWQSKPTVRK